MTMDYSFKLNAKEKKMADSLVSTVKMEFANGSITKQEIFSRIQFAKTIVEDAINDRGIPMIEESERERLIRYWMQPKRKTIMSVFG